MSIFSRWLRRLLFTDFCLCGHHESGHGHYRHGGECSVWHIDGCTRFRRMSKVRAHIRDRRFYRHIDTLAKEARNGQR